METTGAEQATGVTNRFQILSLDGGGVKGMFSAAILAAIEEDFATRVVDHFDLIVGTSTGGIIALSLGAGLAPREILDFYVNEAPAVFNDPWRMRSVLHPFRSKYNSTELKRALQRVLGDRLLGHSSKRLVIPAFDLARDSVHLFKTPHHPRLRRDWRLPMVDVALATSAAPTFFPAAIVDGIALIDGGVWANNPSMVGVVEAVSVLKIPLDAIRLLSLGTTADFHHRSGAIEHAGWLTWIRPSNLVPTILRGQSIGAHNEALHLLGENRILRIDAPVPPGLLRMDRADASLLIGKARAVSRIEGPRLQQLFLDHTATEYRPQWHG